MVEKNSREMGITIIVSFLLLLEAAVQFGHSSLIPPTIHLSISTPLHAFCGTSLQCDPKMTVCITRVYTRSRCPMPQMGLTEACGADKPARSITGVFFRKANLEAGNSLVFPYLNENTLLSSFLPSDMLAKLPFSLEGIPTVESLIPLSSSMKQAMVASLEACIATPSPTEVKKCVMSGESMAQFVEGLLGKNYKVIRWSDTQSMYGQSVSVESLEEVVAPESGHVLCHGLAFPYLVFYCHYVAGSGVYRINTQAGNYIAECHFKTFFYEKTDPVIHSLGIEPGKAEFCHFVGASDALLFAKG